MVCLQFLVALAHVGRNFVKVFLRVDRAAELQQPFWIFCRQYLFPVDLLDAQFALVIGINDLRPADVDLSGAQSVIGIDGDGTASATRFVACPSRLIADLLCLIAHLLRHVATLPLHVARTLSFLLRRDRKSTRLNSSHGYISYAVFCLKK